MPYPQRLLNRQEDVAVDLHPHWSYYAKPAFTVVGAVIVGIVTLANTTAGTTPRVVLAGVSLVLLVGSMMWLIVRYLKWATTHFVLTTERVIFRGGIIAKRGVEIPLERINTVHFGQSMFERMIRVGDLVIESGGDDGQQRFTAVRRPALVQRMIYVEMEEHRRRALAAGGALGADDVASQLERLEGMLQRGTLTPDEFRAHKDRLLRH
jgi:uncharacterized membrane protein YdbT with pleckstrin-like domain